MTDIVHRALAHARRRASAVVLVLLASCANADAGQVQLEAVPASERDARAVDIRAQTTGPMTGARYKWFSLTGETYPQESDQPTTMFTFAEGVTKDRVTVEVWRKDKRIARNELDVTLDESRALLASATRPAVQVEITTVPPYEPYGGAETRADIKGRVVGENVIDYRVVIYARADLWYRQPMPDVSIPVAPDGTFSTWTHTGSSYAAFVVRRDAGLSTRLDVLPRVGGNVVASAIVEGAKKK